jgi:glycine/D-amino acid oxidase-like deaminating enzyme
MDSDYAIIGGGIVGLSVAYGLLDLGKRVSVFDEGDTAFRASRGNFGLIWVQGKGVNAPAYAKWTQRSAAIWPEFANELGREGNLDLVLRQEGGYDYHLSEAGLAERAAEYEALKEKLGGDYSFEVLRHNALKIHEPNIGPDVAGAILHHQDGHVNPLKLLRALAGEARRKGADLHVMSRVTGVSPTPGGYQITTESDSQYTAGRVVLCAGLGACDFAPELGFRASIRPQRGHILMTEKMPKLMYRPSGTLRQVDEGGIQIGASAEEAGFDDRENMAISAQLAHEAIQVFPALARAKLVRSWAALRIMSPDGLPVYQQSKTMPGVFMVTCHSGITLSAVHARILPSWLEGHANAPDLTAFSEDRFDV